MAVIGARPAPRFGLPWRRSRPRQEAPAARRRRTSARTGAQRRKVTGLAPMLTAIAAAAALAVFHLSQSSHVAATGYQIDALEARLAELRAEQGQLVLSIGEARSPAVVQQRAREELRLVPISHKLITYPTPSIEPTH